MDFHNSNTQGFRGQVPVVLEPVVTDTPFGAIHTFVTETGTVVSENAPGQATLDHEGYGFVIAIEFAPTGSGSAVGPYHTAARPERGGHDRERRARDAVLAALSDATLDFLRKHEGTVLELATEGLRAALAAEPVPERRPLGPAPEHRAIFETGYGPVEAWVVENGLISVTGAGFQSSIEAGGRPYALAGTLDDRTADRPSFRLLDVFGADRTPIYHWQDIAPDLPAIAARILADPEMRRTQAARREHDAEASRRRSREQATRERTDALRRLTARIDGLDPTAAPTPAP